MDIDRIGVHGSVDAVFPPERLVAVLSDLDYDVEVVTGDDVSGVDALVTFSYRESFLDVPWIHSIQAGIDRFPLEELEAEGVVLTNSTGIHGESVGEMVLGYMISLARNLHGYARKQADHTWERPPWDRPFTLAGESVCVVGLGTLGRGIATRADAIGMEVTGVKRTVEPVEGVETVYPATSLVEAIGEARFVAVTVPLTEQTRGLIGPAELEAIDEDAYLINVARGPVVDEEALVSALQEESIAGAALDVFETEPLPSDSPLWDREDTLITPHVAATIRSYYEDIAELVEGNLRRNADGKPLENRIV